MKNSLRHVVVRDSDGTRIAIFQDDIETFRLDRDPYHGHIWALRRVVNGVPGPVITRDQYSADLIEAVTANLILPGELIDAGEHFLLVAPANAADFYVSGTGFLCARRPARMVLTAMPVEPFGITMSHHVIGKISHEAIPQEHRNACNPGEAFWIITKSQKSANS